MENRRQFQRFEVELKNYKVDKMFLYEIVDDDVPDEISLHRMGVARIEDISASGVKIRTTQLLPTGIKLDITMSPPGTPKERISTIGQIRWSKPTSHADEYYGGIELLEPLNSTADEILNNYVATLEQRMNEKL